MSDSGYAVLFPGQGSQLVGMLAPMAERYAVIEATFSEASQVLGYDLWALAQNGPQEDMNLTEKTQPLLLASSVAIWRVMRDLGAPTPSFLAGHSLGEFSALVCAEVIGFAEAVDVVRQRGQFMQTAVPVGVGAMAAIIGLDDEKIREVCAGLCSEEVVEAVNYNSPGQVVIAGHAAAVGQAIDLCKAAGAKRALPLPVSAPFHTSLMQPAGEKLAAVIQALDFSAPVIPIVHNVTAEPESEVDRIRAIMIEQIHSPVRWSECVAYIASRGVTSFMECGPGKVLSGLCRRIDKSLSVVALENPDVLEKAVADI